MAQPDLPKGSMNTRSQCSFLARPDWPWARVAFEPRDLKFKAQSVPTGHMGPEDPLFPLLRPKILYPEPAEVIPVASLWYPFPRFTAGKRCPAGSPAQYSLEFLAPGHPMAWPSLVSGCWAGLMGFPRADHYRVRGFAALSLLNRALEPCLPRKGRQLPISHTSAPM